MLNTPFRLPAILGVIVLAVAMPSGQVGYERSLEVRPSRIPNAGNGVFATAAIPKDAYLGSYGGEFITEAEYLRRAAEGRWQYMMGLIACAKPNAGGLETIDGINGNVFTRMNYAPPDLQNVRFEKVCEPPFVKVIALRDIAAGEELWVDYGPRYHYDFMNDPAVTAFFAAERARRARSAAGAGTARMAAAGRLAAGLSVIAPGR